MGKGIGNLKHISIEGLDFKNYTYEYELFRDDAQLDRWRSAGHTIENTKIGIKQILDTSEFNDIKLQFPHLTHIGICFHVLKPGNYLPEHQDRYGFYASKFNVSDLNQIERTVVFLEDHKSGHFLTVGKEVFSNWSAGDSVSWRGTIPHSAINLGLEHRFTLQVTGILCP
jgi:hypothetical protein